MRNGILITFILLSINLTAQVNTEKYRTPEYQLGVSGFFELSGTIKTGNTDKIEAGFDGRLDWKVSNSTTFFVFESDYEWNEGTRASNNGLLHIRHVRKLVNNLSAEAFGQINYDKKILVDNRELIGAGLRYKIFEHEKSDIYFGSAYMFEHENYNLSEDVTHPTEVKVSRWSNYLSAYFEINPAVTFGGVIYYQPMFTNFSDYRLLTESSLTVGITKVLSLSINFKVRHDFIPPDGIEKTDTKTDFGIALKF